MRCIFGRHELGWSSSPCDWLGKDRLLNVQEGDLLALLSAGAYGMSMASNYNSRCLPAEVLVDGNRAVLIRSGSVPKNFSLMKFSSPTLSLAQTATLINSTILLTIGFCSGQKPIFF